MAAEKVPAQVSCPTCGQQVAWVPEEAFRPFCCERCKLIDLGEWATEGYAIPEKEFSLDDVDVDTATNEGVTEYFE